MYLEEMLEFNKKFVADKKYIQYETDSLPNKRMVILHVWNHVLLNCYQGRLTYKMVM